MKKSIFAFILGVVLATFCVQVQAAEEQAMPEPANAANPLTQFTGNYWVHTTPGSKEAYLFGIESAIAIEKEISSLAAANAAKAGKKPRFTLSPFEKGWMEAFKNTTRKEMMDDLDKWYADHPANLDRPVLSVLWFEIIEPRLNAAGAK